MVAQGVRTAIASAAGGDKRHLILGVAAVMVSAQLAFRAWALYPSWFYTDDYTLMNQARAHRLPDIGYLTEPFNSHFMPFGKLLIWLVAHSGTTNWALAATSTMVVQLLTSCACLWMLHTLFGVRWATLALLALFLTNAMAMPALMWWTACLTQLPVQLAFFIAVGAWVRYLRTQHDRWYAITALALLFGLSSDVRVMLVAPLLVYVMLVYFGTGRPIERVVALTRRHWRALSLGGMVTVGYTVFYILSVPPPFERSTAADGSRVRRSLEVADSMLGNALTSGAVGGPWQWYNTTPPIVLAAPPGWAVHLSWVAISLTFVFSVLRRMRAQRGWALMLGYALGLYVLLIVSRGQTYGRLAGMEYRYLTDMICVIPLCLGLVFLELRGAPGSSIARADPVLRKGPRRVWVSAMVATVCLGGFVTSVLYVDYWHHDNASRTYVLNLQRDLAKAQGKVALPNQMVPPEVMPSYTSPNDLSENFVPLVASNARFPSSSDRLRIIGGDGQLRPAEIKTGYLSVPGTVPDCGHRITSSATIDLDGKTFPFTWWIRIGYIASADSPVTVSAGDSVVQARVRAGLHSLFVKLDGSFDSVTIGDLVPGTTMCVDTIEVGDAIPGEGE